MPGVYISWPFCAQKCTYCNFASGVFPRQLEQDYLSALQAEIAAASWPWTPETVYLGGGTPSGGARGIANTGHESLLGAGLALGALGLALRRLRPTT